MYVASGFLANSFDNIFIKYLLPISVFQLAGQMFFSVYFSAAIFYDKVKAATSIVIISNVLRITGLYIAIEYYEGLEPIIWVLNLTSVLQAISMYLILPKNAKGIGKYDRGTMKEIFTVGGPMMLTSVADRSAVYIDGILISAMLTTSQYAIYRAGAFEVPFISSLYGSVSVILIPELIKLIQGDKVEDAVRLKSKAISTTAFIIYPILVYILFFSKPILSIYLTEKYAESALIFSIFSLALLVRINDYQDILIAKGKASGIFKISLFMLLLNVILNYFFIKNWGIVGGAMAYFIWLIGYASLLAYTTAASINKTVNDFFDFKKMLKILFVSTVICSFFYLIYLYYENNYIAVGSAFIYFPLVFIILYRSKIIDNAYIDQLLLKIPIPAFLKSK